MATPKTVAFHTLGCKLNFSETSSIRRKFENLGYHTVNWSEHSDIYVLNTCSVTDFADRKCRAEVRKVLRISPGAKVVVIGCYAQLKPDEIANIPGVDLVLGAAEKFNIHNYIDSLSKATDKGMINAGDVKEVNSFEDAFSFGDRTRTFLKVQDGCDYKCTFCTIPQARGRSRSATIDQVLNNVSKIADEGVKEIVLTGVNIGDFGLGANGKRQSSFLDLIRALDHVEGIERLRISSIEPNLCSDEIIQFVATSERIMPHFHMPLQSGSDRILSLMRRRYKLAVYTNRIQQIKQLIPHCCIGVDVIVGFPGETEKDFKETFDYLLDQDISYLHVFTYSERANTLAATMGEKVPMHIRRERNKILRELSDKKKRSFYQQHLNTSRPVLIEKNKKDGSLTGFTDNYIKVKIDTEEGKENVVKAFRLYQVSDNGILHVAATPEVIIA